MYITRHINKINALSPCVLTIGNFDGVHVGHKKIIDEINKIARKKNLASAILTFQPHPIKLFKPELASHFNILTLAQKLKIFRSFKISHTVIAPFNRNFSDISADDFINKILIEKLNVKHLIIGYDFIFGKNREGNLQTLQNASKRHQFSITNIDAHKIDNEICSSTVIRKLLQNGKIKQANQILGRNFTLEGIVVEGKKLARTIGFATANINTQPHIIQPKFGVYKVLATIDGINKNGIMNFGVKPTIGEVLQPIYEIHIFDFNQEIYGKKISFELLDFIREEKKFESLDALKQQLRIDIDRIKNS